MMKMKAFLTGERSPKVFYVKHGIEQAFQEGLAYAPYFRFNLV